MRIPALTLALALASLSCAAAESPSAPDRATAGAAVTRYLADHGDFCLGKMDWPVDISGLDERARGRDVVQMPVLEALGLVRSGAATALRVEGAELEEGAAPVPVAVRRYELTPLGERFVRERAIAVPGPQGERRVRRRDLCAAQVSLDAVVDWRVDAEGLQATYTYAVVAAPWAASPEFRRVFPMAARVIDGAHRMTLKQAFTWKDGAWMPAGLAN